MINFIVLEDNLYHRNFANTTIKKFMMKNDIDYKILNYDDFNDKIKKTIKNDEITKIYILDFELPSATAIDVAKEIRNNDWTSPIIILTAHGGMAFETFKERLQILDFISKQYDSETNLFELFEICLKQIKIKKNFKFKSNYIDYIIPYDNILYFYRDTFERKVKLVTVNEEINISKSLAAIKLELDQNFIYTHKACIINKKKVKGFDWKNKRIIFDNDTEINLLSKNYKKEIENVMV